MRPECAKFLHDVRQALVLLRDFSRGKSFDDYQADALLSAAVEREFIIIGEALLRASRLEPGLSQSITAFPQIIALRNLLLHRHAVVQKQIVLGIPR